MCYSYKEEWEPPFIQPGLFGWMSPDSPRALRWPPLHCANTYLWHQRMIELRTGSLRNPLLEQCHVTSVVHCKSSNGREFVLFDIEFEEDRRTGLVERGEHVGIDVPTLGWRGIASDTIRIPSIRRTLRHIDKSYRPYVALARLEFPTHAPGPTVPEFALLLRVLSKQSAVDGHERMTAWYALAVFRAAKRIFNGVEVVQTPRKGRCKWDFFGLLKNKGYMRAGSGLDETTALKEKDRNAMETELCSIETEYRKREKPGALRGWGINCERGDGWYSYFGRHSGVADRD